jgi:GH24 family phage-related lysozyme (muramidase)/LAS superfamily LD-carboxypeptidase LdcB
MLSDMLVGFLKAIPFTRIGKEKFKNYNEGRNVPILNLVELKIKVNQINAAIEKLALNSGSSKILNSFSEGKDIINSILSEYTTFSISGLKKNSDDESSYRFLVTNNADFTSDQKNAYQTLDTNVRDYIKKYNDLNITGMKLTDTDFLPLTYVPDLTIPKLNANSTETLDTTITGEELIKFKREALDYVTTYMTFSDAFKFRMYDLRQTIDLLEKEKTKLDSNVETANKELANEIKNQITSELGFDPTVRNMIEIFTGLIEVFIETIYEVSQSAEGNLDRKAELEKVFKDTFNNDIPDVQIKAKEFYPWPDYTEKANETSAYVEKYLGSNPTIDSKLSIDEIKFIEDLLQAFLTANELENAADALAVGDEINWFPSNPLDTRIFGNEKSPYQRADLISLEAVQRLMLIRGMTFLGYTNDEKYLKPEDIQTMAKLEANAIAAAAQPTLKNVLKNIKPETIKDVKGVVNSHSRKLVSDTPNGYSYTYLFVGTNPDKELRVLPINGDFNDKTIGGSITKKITAANIDQTVYVPDTSIPTVPQVGAVKTTNYSYIIDNGSYDNEDTRDFLKELTNTEYFLTNYNSIRVDSTYKKFIDGGTYIKMLKPSEFTTTAQLIDASIKTDSIINLEQLKKSNISQAGFNCFGGSYGIQEFVNMDYGDKTGLKGLPLMYVFYSPDKDYGLSYTRKDSVKHQNLGNNKTLSNIFDFKLNESTYLASNEYYDDGMLVDVKRDSRSKKLLHSGRGNNRELFNNLVDPNTGKYKISYPYIEHGFVYGLISSSTDKDTLSLFGSKWYYLQANSRMKKKDNTYINNISGKYTKALIFLNTLPFNLGDEILDDNPLFPKELRHLFDVSGGFVHTPRIWCAFIGGMLWWMSTEDPIIEGNSITGGGRGKEDPIVWKTTCGSSASPKYSATELNGKYLPRTVGRSTNDVKSDDILLSLPNQVKEEFKKIFFDFVNGTSEYISFDTLRKELEIFDDSKPVTQFCGFVDSLYNTSNPEDNQALILPSQITSNLINYKNYNIINLAKQTSSLTLFLELNDDSTAVTNLLTSLKEEVIIANTGYRIWRGPLTDNFGTSGVDLTSLRYPIYASNTNYDMYFKTLTTELAALTEGYSTSTEKDAALNEIFNTANLNDIKLMLYRNCKNIYDKWLGGVTNPDNIIFQCGENSITDSNRNQTDLAIANKYGRTKARLIDSFRFVNRSFRDIGDELFINPLPLMSKLDDFPNTSAYEIISGLLGDNKFDFIALPTFINFHDDKVLETMFKPISMYEEPIKTCGPSFVCVYVGQKSKNLDLKDASTNYTNDGFDINCVNGNLNPTIPKDFTTPLGQKSTNGGDLSKPYEDPIPVFAVRYGQQNQNLFKDITLDQSEFSESEESIKIVQDISMKGAETSMTIGGQNMYNVYSVRSYNAEVEMMGNAMIQPMMYFQLDNIPMFHGAYMITRVKHNIKPNNMSTNFTGVRIRAAETPIIDVADAYMSLIETLNVAGAGKAASGAVAGSFPPIVRTIIENGGVNGDIESPNIKLVPVEEIAYVQQDVPVVRRKMIAEAVPALTEMLKAFVDFAKAQGYPTINKKYVGMTSLYRTVAYQQELYDANKANGGKPGAVAEPGTSNHSWGIAVDLLFAPQKDGNYLKKGAWAPISTSAAKEGFDLEYNPSLKWFLDNGYKYGFIIPATLRDKTSVDEYWHFEYHGTSAKCLYNKYPSTYGYIPKLDSVYKPIVVNPKGIDNKIAVYLEKDCDYKYIKSGDGSSGVVNQNMINTLSGDWVARAKTIIKSFEGYLAKAKKDTGTWRGGYGTDNIIKSSGSKPEKVTSFTTFTQIQADLTLEYDINDRFKKEIIRVLGQQNWDKLNANQKAAITSYSYNAGAGQLKSKGIVTAITNNDYKKASSEILSGPTTSQGKVLEGLVIRRKTESLIFDKPI